MDRLISATEANQRFSEMLRDVAGGESFTVTSRGKPIARISPVATDRVTQRAKVDKLLAYLKTLPPTEAKQWTREDLYD